MLRRAKLLGALLLAASAHKAILDDNEVPAETVEVKGELVNSE